MAQDIKTKALDLKKMSLYPRPEASSVSCWGQSVKSDGCIGQDGKVDTLDEIRALFFGDMLAPPEGQGSESMALHVD